MTLRTKGEAESYVEGYVACYNQFNECLEKHSKSIAINKMKLYVQAVVNVLTLIDTKMEVKA